MLFCWMWKGRFICHANKDWGPRRQFKISNLHLAIKPTLYAFGETAEGKEVRDQCGGTASLHSPDSLNVNAHLLISDLFR